jgi:hypothetical protein
MMFQLSCNLGNFMGIPLIFGLSTIFSLLQRRFPWENLGGRMYHVSCVMIFQFCFEAK